MFYGSIALTLILVMASRNFWDSIWIENFKYLCLNVQSDQIDRTDQTEPLINLLYSPISFDEVLWETEKRKMPLKNAPILQCGVIRVLIYSVEGSRSQGEKLTFFFLWHIYLLRVNIWLKATLSIEELFRIPYMN